MAPYFSSARDNLQSTQVQYARSNLPAIFTRHLRGSVSPLLISSSIRAATSSPRLVHGNSPLLNSVEWSPDFKDEEHLPSPGQFSDAEIEEGLNSPSSAALQDQLQNATKALEELKEAVRRRRLIKKQTHLPENMACIGTEKECPQHSSAGLGLGLLMNDLQSKLIGFPLPSKSREPVQWRDLSDLPTRRHWLADDTQKPCNTTSSKSWSTSTNHDNQVLSPQIVASPTMMSTAPPTPSLENGTFGIVSTPGMPSSTSTANNTTQQQQGHSESSSFASHHNNNATAIAAVGAVGVPLILAALFIAIYFRKAKSKQHQSKMDSVLEKVAPLPTDGGDSEMQNNGAIGSQDYFAAASHAGNTSPNMPDCRTVPPWLPLNMGTHPFASATTKTERFSHDLLDSGLVGEQRPIKDYSFSWNFPKLSVPPAAARAISTGHYVKKRVTVVPANLANQPEKAKPISQSSSTTRRCSSVRDNMSQSASSECVDPEIDHRRKSFAILEVSSKPLGWIKSAFRHLTPTQQQNQQQNDRDIEWIDDSSVSTPWIPSISSSRLSGSQSSEDQSLSLTMQKSNTSLAYFAPDSFALTQAVVQQVMEIRLPSLSIANSPMLDVKESALSSTKQAARISSLKWSKDIVTPPQPQRSFSSGSEKSNAPQLNRGVGIRRVSWAGPLESCREDSKESVLHLSSSVDSASKVMNARKSQIWNANSDITDTDDETREGYEAEEEEEGMDTELESDNNYLPSTPVITLTCSEEEGRFERQISLNSVYRSATSSDDHSKLEEQKKQQQQIASTLVHSFQTRDDDGESDDDDGATIIVHSSASAEDNSSDSDSCHSGALHSLLVDDFPTIPEWTPTSVSSRSPY